MQVTAMPIIFYFSVSGVVYRRNIQLLQHKLSTYHIIKNSQLRKLTMTDEASLNPYISFVFDYHVPLNYNHYSWHSWYSTNYHIKSSMHTHINNLEILAFIKGFLPYMAHVAATKYPLPCAAVVWNRSQEISRT